MKHCAIVGGGVAGLEVAKLLLETGAFKVTLFDQHATAGGRLRDAGNEAENGETPLQTAAWRVPESHTRTLAWFRAAGVALTLCYECLPSNALTHDCPESVIPDSAAAITELSDHGISAEFTSESFLCAMNQHGQPCNDAFQQFPGISEQIAGAHAYEAAPDELYYEPAQRGSFAQACVNTCTRLQRKYPERVQMHYGTRVTSVAARQVTAGADANSGAQYVVRASANDDPSVRHDAAFDAVFLCVPPWQYASLNMGHVLKPLQAAVEALQLCHTYFAVSGPGAMALESLEGYDCGTLLGQLFRVNAETHGLVDGTKKIFHTYTSGDAAMQMRTQHVRGTLENYLHFLLLQSNPRVKKFSVRVIQCTYFQRGIGLWRPPTAHLLTLDDVRKTAVRPNCGSLPKVYAACEALSRNQGWVQGALEMAERAVRAFKDDVRSGFAIPRALRFKAQQHDCRNLVHINGRLVDVGQFYAHPGGQKALEKAKKMDDAERSVASIHDDSSVFWNAVLWMTVAYVRNREKSANGSFPAFCVNL